MTVHRCPLCRIGMDIDYHYPLQYMWCDDCRMKVTKYLTGLNMMPII